MQVALALNTLLCCNTHPQALQKLVFTLHSSIQNVSGYIANVGDFHVGNP